MNGLAVFPLKGELWRSQVELSVTCRVLEGLDSRLLGKKWTINKGLTGLKNLAEGYRLQLQASRRVDCWSVGGPWALPPSKQSCNSHLRWVRWVSRL